MGPTWIAFRLTSRLTAFSLKTSSAAFRRSSVPERTSMSLSSWLIEVPVSLKSNRCEISRRAWSTAFATSGIETWETMSNEKSVFAMDPSYRGWTSRPPLLSWRRIPGGCPSGQRERSVKSPAKPTEVRILLLPPTNHLPTNQPTDQPTVRCSSSSNWSARRWCAAGLRAVGADHVGTRPRTTLLPRPLRWCRGALGLFLRGERADGLERVHERE